MNDWLTALEQAVLVTVAQTEGSVPRKAGAKMIVNRTRQADTIGGGHLEWRAIEIARAMLAGGAAVSRLERIALGPSLGQCCGGVVWVAFEVIHAELGAVLAALRERRQTASWRVTALDAPVASALFDADGKLLAGSSALSAGDINPVTLCAVTHVLTDSAGRRWLVDPCLPPQAHLTLFGAGHVGAALVRALADLPCSVTWVDEREDMFPPVVPSNVRIEATDTPEALIAAAPAGGSFLVMTHSHALDLRLSRAILASEARGWFGLIGSLTKRRQFEHRLRDCGVAPERIDAMVCPIGLPGISDKTPAVIAASVCAQLLMVWQAVWQAAH